MKLSFMIFINKLITKVCKLFGKNGSVYPGYIVYDILKQKKVLENVKYPELVIAVTGSSGKGSTTDLINQILSSAGYDVCYNKNGSNGVLAATTLILNNCNIKGEFLHDVLLLECDERHLKLMFGKNKMTHLIVTNVTRDQPARNGDPDIVFNDILKAIGEDTKLIVNSDDPLVNRLTYKFKNEYVTYGVSKTDDSYLKSSIDAVDYAYCPKCHTKKFLPSGIGMMRFHGEVFKDAPDVVKTAEIFGGGHYAARDIIIRNHVYRTLTENLLDSSLVFEPIELI